VQQVQRAVGVFSVIVCLATPAVAQDIAQLIATGDKHVAAYQYGDAIKQYQAVPDTATADQRLEKQFGLAMSYMGLNNFIAAEGHVQEALTIAKGIGSNVALARAEAVHAMYLDQTNTGDRGISLFLHAAALAERAGPPARTALAAIYSNLASAYQNVEDWERETYYTQKAWDLNPDHSPPREFNYRMGRAIAFFELYERDAAEKEYRLALDLSAVTKRPRDRAFALSELGFLYFTFDKDFARALPLYDEAIELYRVARVTGQEANAIGNRGNVYRDTANYDRALQDYREAIRLFDSGGQSSRTFFLWKNIGQVMRLQGRTADAAALLKKLIDERAQDAGPRHMWQAQMELASALATLGDRAGARQHFEAMIDVLEEQRKSAILDAYRTGTLAHALSAYDPYDRYIRFLIDGGGSGAADALAIAERARAREFLEALASVRSAVAAKLPATLFEEESRVTRAISDAQKQLRSPALDKAQRAAALAALTRAENAREIFILKMRVEHPNLAEARYPSLLKPAQIQEALRPGETAIAFFLSEPNSLRWTLRRDTIRLDTIPGRAAIERDANRVRDLVRGLSSPAELRDATTKLSAALLSGIDVAGDRPLTMIPHGVLHYIPFEVLPVGDRLLVERHAVSYAPSLNALVQLRRSPPNAATFRVLAVGDPSLDSPRADAPRVAGSGQGERLNDTLENLSLLEPLPYAAQELQRIGRTFPDRTRILSGASARETDLRSPVTSQFPVIHFATHGLVSDVQPKRSGLLMAPEPGEDGLLQVSEIYGLGLRANLIVLSACQTALGKEITGEGLIGLSRAFFYAGARSVVATLWNLNDRFAAEFVERFYRELNTGINAEEALRRAKAAYVNDPNYSHPFYWSSLVLLGDGTLPLVAEPVRQPRLSTAAALVLAALAMTIVLLQSRNPARI
jgi:CHAT domain-containing protein